ncbi:aminoglycoside phosphotransferase family protein [Streptomyces sp. NPDC004126]|uniref:aminoglycoside phosphotransferase family protein n=1 Tax=Streptomyces sp. NPDC004126 TaxID=3390695 RepID=UPI003CFD2018
MDAQFPHWAGLPLRPVEPAGSDHVIHRLGEDLSVRLPRHADAAGQADKEARWLPRLAPRLPLAVPQPVAVGRPGEGYPWHWAVTRWIPGATATVEALGESRTAARQLAGFLGALHRIPVGYGPPAGLGTAGPAAEAAPLADRDRDTRAAIAASADVFDADAMTRLWDAALDAPGWAGPRVWCHGDLHTGNLLTRDGRLSAVIDFGELAVGDPAVDLTIAFTLLTPRTRPVFRQALALDAAAWTRGRGWALATGLSAHTAYAATVPRVAAQTTRQITQALLG